MVDLLARGSVLHDCACTIGVMPHYDVFLVVIDSLSRCLFLNHQVTSLFEILVRGWAK
jgi:hypothetical protein